MESIKKPPNLRSSRNRYVPKTERISLQSGKLYFIFTYTTITLCMLYCFIKYIFSVRVQLYNKFMKPTHSVHISYTNNCDITYQSIVLVIDFCGTSINLNYKMSENFKMRGDIFFLPRMMIKTKNHNTYVSYILFCVISQFLNKIFNFIPRIENR